MEELNRDILLSYAQSLTVSELGSSLENEIAGIAVIDILNKRIVFQDRMTQVLGPAALQEMYLETYFQLIPEYQRNVVSIQYSEAISRLVDGVEDNVTIIHEVQTSQHLDNHTIELSFSSKHIDAYRYLIGIVRDVTPDRSQLSYSQLMSGDINTYVFTYDILVDTLYLSYRFCQDFDIPSGVLEKFTQNYVKYMYPEDAVYLNEIFSAYLETRTIELGTVIRFLAPGRGDLYLRLDGVSDHNDISDEECRYISGILTDVTELRAHNLEIEAFNEGSEAVRFVADINRATLKFSDNIQDIFNVSSKVITGDFVEEVAQHIVVKDRKRFRNAMYRAVNEIGSKFSVEFRYKLGGQRIVWIALRGKSFFDPIRNSNIMTGSIINLSSFNATKEVIEKKEASNEITGLPTRDKLVNDSAAIIRNPDVLSCALILVDISDFHVYNDNYGRDAGNAVVSAVAAFIGEKSPEDAELYHIGIDTFAILWTGASRRGVTSFIEGVIADNNVPMVTTMGDFFVNLSIAASMYPEGDTADDLLGNAEIALHKIKNDKTLKYVIYSPADKLELSKRMDFVSQITSCIMNKMENFQLYYQPLIDAKTGVLAGAEALLRWQSNQGELVNPELVVAALEEADRMADVGRWIANEAIKQCAKWISKGAPRDFYIHINATADDLVRDDYATEISDLLQKYNLEPKNILVELTETSLMENMGKCRKNLVELNNAGIRTALDDFGSGYSSFNYLKELPVDEIKIDKTFTDDMETVEFNASFIEAMTMLAHSINKSVVVEGVETESQVEKLRSFGADIFQGYYYGKPMSVFSFWNRYFAK